MIDPIYLQRNLINQLITSEQSHTEELDPQDVALLNAWLQAHPQEIKVSPALSSLSRRIKLVQSSPMKGLLLNLHKQATDLVKKTYQTMIPGHLNAKEIEKLILKKDFKKLESYFCEYPEDLITYSNLIKIHINLENLLMQDLLPLLEKSAASANHLHSTDSFISKPKEVPSIFNEFYEEIESYLRKSSPSHTFEHLFTQDRGRSLEKFNFEGEDNGLSLTNLETFLPFFLEYLPTDKLVTLLNSKNNDDKTRLDLLKKEVFNKLSGRFQVRFMSLLVNKIPESELLSELPAHLNSLKETIKELDYHALHSNQIFSKEEKKWILVEHIKMNEIPLRNLKNILSEDDFLHLAPDLQYIDLRDFDNVSLGRKIIQNCSSPHKLRITEDNMLQEIKSLPFCTELDCSYCRDLQKLPELPVCTKLSCSCCGRLKILPELPVCTYLNCFGCPCLEKISNLPACIEVSCCLCEALKSISKLPMCRKFTCSECWALKSVAGLPMCREFTCSLCRNLKLLPELPMCTKFTCNFCHALLSLPNLQACMTLDCSNCTNLTALPESLPVCVNLDYRNSPITRVPVLPANARVNDDLESAQLSVNIEDFQKNPIKLLQKIGTYLVNNPSFPQIDYFENNILSEAVDLGGVQRDFVTRLMDSVFKEAEWEDHSGVFLKYDQGLPSTSSYLVNKEAKLSILNKEIELFTAEESKALSLKEEIKNSFFKDDTQTREAKEAEASSLKREIEVFKAREMEGFKAFGALLALCYSDSSEFKTGPLPFSESLFEALTVGNPESPGEIPSDKWLLNAIAITAELSEEAKKSLINLEEPLVGTESDLFRLIYLLELDEEIKWSWSMLQNDTSIRSKIIEQAKEHPTVAILKLIAQTMKSRLEPQSWNDLQRLEPGELKEKIEGQLNADMLKQHIDWEASPSVDQSKLNKVKTYFEAWVDANQENKAELELFVRAVTGNKTLTRRMKAGVFNRETNRIPETHTCSFSIEFTQDYQDQETFNKALSELLAVVSNGTGFGFA